MSIEPHLPTSGGAAEPIHVVLLVLDSIVPFDLGVACQVFGYARPDLGAMRYRMTLCAAEPGPVTTSVGFPVTVDRGLDALEEAHTIIVPGIRAYDAPAPPAVVDALRAAHARGARIASICTGAFVLAEAGLLDGRKATTHWKDAALLAERYPEVCVDPRVLYVDEGQVLTSAGIAAGIDLCLHIVRRDWGAEVANALARRLVVPPHRSGGQAQFVEEPVPARPAGGLERTRTWTLEHLDRRVTVDEMARHAATSRRNFTRRFRAETGTSPLQWLLQQRVLRARRLLETTEMSVGRIALECGFGSALSLRDHFTREVGATPAAYRRAFGVRRVSVVDAAAA
ncbi:MAG TPA: helix-turn-helix domain-containing protein [Longimicrobium sp.]